MKVVICGAGIAGLALAQRLAVQGNDVVVLEKAPGPRTQGLARLPGLDHLIAAGPAGKHTAIITQLDRSTGGVSSWH